MNPAVPARNLKHENQRRQSEQAQSHIAHKTEPGKFLRGHGSGHQIEHEDAEQQVHEGEDGPFHHRILDETNGRMYEFAGVRTRSWEPASRRLFHLDREREREHNHRREGN